MGYYDNTYTGLTSRTPNLSNTSKYMAPPVLPNSSPYVAPTTSYKGPGAFPTSPSFGTANTTPAFKAPTPTAGSTAPATTSQPVAPGAAITSPSITNVNSGGSSTLTPPPAGPGTLTPPPTAPTTTPTTPQGTNTPASGTSYTGLIGRVAGASTPTGTQTGLIGTLGSTAAGNQAIGQSAADIAAKYGAEINRVGQMGANVAAGDLSTGSNVVGAGNAAIASQAASQRMAALTGAGNMALQGTGQQLTGQQQAANAYNQALGGANVQQGQQITGLGTAAGFAAPVQIAPGSTLASPQTGAEVAGGLGGWAGYTTAQQAQALGGQYPTAGFVYDPSKSSAENLARAQALTGGSAQLQKELFGTPGAQSIKEATQIQIAQQGLGKTTETYNNMNQQYNYADQNMNRATSVLNSNGINPTASTWVNGKIQDLKRQFSSSDQAAFDAALQGATLAYQAIVTASGAATPTAVTESYNTVLNPNSSPAAMMAALNVLKQEGYSRLSTTYDVLNTYSGAIPGGTTGGGTVSWDSI